MNVHRQDSAIEARFNAVARSKTFQNLMQSFRLHEKAVLDVGCSYGEYLTHFGKGSVGLTVSKEEKQYGEGKGLDVRCWNIESETFNIEPDFDVIFANNILEHLHSPHKFLIKIKGYLREGGILILGVPVVPGFNQLVHVMKFRGSLAVNHINFFTRFTLVKTTERAGWKVLEARTFRFPFPSADTVLNLISPHIFTIAVIDTQFRYHEKRLKELDGYTQIKE